jgi:hypothetical protein
MCHISLIACDIISNQMSIQTILLKIKLLLQNDRFFISVLIILVGVTSFGLGRLSIDKDSKTPITIKNTKISTEKPVSDKGLVNTKTDENSGFVASKNGTKYHFPWCAGAKQISAENKIFFATKEEAKNAGFSPAQNCPGLE